MVEGEADAQVEVDQHAADEQLIAYYEKAISERITGPQLEGLTKEWLQDALKDERTKLIELGDGVSWPLFIPVEHNHDYQKGFFDNHFADRPAYYLSLPPQESVVDDYAVVELLEKLRQERAIVSYDMMVDANGETTVPKYLQYDFVQDVTPESSAYGQSYGLPKVTHFEGTARFLEEVTPADGDPTAAFRRLVEAGRYEYEPAEGAVVLDPEALAQSPETLQRIWEMYEEQFSELTEDHPSLQISPRAELERMLTDKDTLNLAYIQEGKIVALCYFVSNIKKAEWLNDAFYDELHQSAPDVKLSYFPGIVVDSKLARQDGGYVGSMITLLQDVWKEAGLNGLQITFQCTNVSETYIPKIVTHEVTKYGTLTFEQAPDQDGSSFRKTAEYQYRVASFSND